jgi:uncharacterized caspase-like protein
MGVNSTEPNVFSTLDFAADDARAIAATLSDKLKAGDVYRDVVAIQLLTEKGQSAATKEKLAAVLALLAGRTATPAALKGILNVEKLHKAGPDDLVFVFFAGHGYASKGKYHLIPSDLGKNVGTDIGMYLDRTISDDDLNAWFRDIDASDIVLVVDACYSAAAIDPKGEFRAGPMGDAGMGQLAYDKGMRVLAAAERQNQTWQSGDLHHGYLTYALVHDGLQEGKADFHPKDGKIFMGEWLSFSVKRVPELELSADHPPTPALFNFLWKQTDPLVTTVQ